MINYTILLAALAVVESDSTDTAIGKAGERSRYQITASVWYEHTMEPFSSARIRGIAERVALDHIQHCIEPALKRAGREVTIHAIAGCWNMGISGYLNTKPTPQKRRTYIKHVVDNYNRLLKEDAKRAAISTN